MTMMLAARRLAAGPVPVPVAYAAAAKAKLERDRKSYAAFRAVDQQEHDEAYRRRVTSAVALAEDEVALWRLDIEGAEPEAARVLAGFRSAEDRARKAAEYARQQRAAYERVKGKCEAEEETGALILADTSDQVAIDARRDMDQQRAGLAEADRALAEAREGLAAAERELDRARKAAGIPAGTAPISDVTVRANASYMQADQVWDALSTTDRQRVRNATQPRDAMSVQEWQAMMSEVLETGGYVA